MQTVLSIQSHVAYGTVGNRAAVFTLQRLGFDVIAVNTVQFSNHTGYGTWTGEAFTPAHIADVLDGVEARGGLSACSGVLSGYQGDPAVGHVILRTVERIRGTHPAVIYCCDPVMGDHGRGIFVKPGIPEFFRRRLVPAADLITPNCFELSVLTALPANSLAEVLTATAAVRSLGPKTVLVTSLFAHLPDADRIGLLADTADGAWLVTTPKLPLEPTPNGAGDTVAALFLAFLLRDGDAAAALGHACNSLFGIFAATEVAKTRELQLVAAQDELAHPSRQFEVERVR